MEKGVIIEKIEGKEYKYSTEEQMQAIIFQWFWNKYPQYRRMLFHVQQNMFGNAYRGSINKAIGVVKGVADLVLVCKGVCVFLELKVGGNNQSAEQKEFENKVCSYGHKYIVVRSIDQFIGIIISLRNNGLLIT